LRVAATVFLVVSALVFIRPDPVEAWSYSEGAVLVLEDIQWPGPKTVVDSSGNSYITGKIREPSNCCGNRSDASVTKVDSSGNVVWTKVFETVPGGVGYSANWGEDEGTAITLDSSGNIYATGYYRTTVDFDPNEGTVELTAAWDYDIFVVKLDSSGNLVWAKSVGSYGNLDRSHGIAVDSSGNVHVAGRFRAIHNWSDFDPGDDTVPLPYAGENSSNGANNMFILKLDSSGNYVWAKSMGGTDETPNANLRANAVAVDSSGNVYTTGDFGSWHVDLDPGAGTEKFSTNGNQDVFVLKLDSSGNYVWAETFGSATGHRGDEANLLTLDSSGNIHVSGKFVGPVDFDPGAGTAELTPAGVGSERADGDVFVLKLDPSGSYVWAKGLGGSSYDAPKAMVVDSSGNVHIAGAFQETADFDPNAGTEELTSAGGNDVFVSKLDSSGNYVWAKSISSANSISAPSMGIDSSGNVYAVGMWGAGVTIDFDPGVGTVNLTNETSDSLVWLAKLDSSGNLAPGGTTNPGFTLSTTSVSVAESGTTATFSVVLDAQPAGNVVIYAFSSDPGEAQVGAPLTFTSSNWATPQNFTITGRDDSIVDGDQQAIFTVKIDDDLSHDSYDNVADQTVTSTTSDDESPVVTTTPIVTTTPTATTTTTTPTATTTTTTTVPTGLPSVVLSASAMESDAFISWVPNPADGVQSHALAWRDPSGNWSMHNSYDGTTLNEDTIFDLSDGVHSFEILTSYVNGSFAMSNTASITVPTPPPSPTPEPEVVEVGGFDCSTYPSLIQVMGTPGVGDSVKQLDVNTGVYSEIFSISVNRTPRYTGLNAIGINPVDSALYGLMRVQGFAYLVRFDDADNVAFVARVPGMSNAGDVDAQGRFVWPQGTTSGTNFYVLENVAGMDGFADPGDAADRSQITPVVTGTGATADVAALRVNLGSGERFYAMGVDSHVHKLRIFDYENPARTWTVNLFDADGSPAQFVNGGFGAAWSHEDRFYFASNKGEGVYEVIIPTIDLNTKTATIRRVANSQATSINDGTTCVGIDFIEPDPTPEVVEVGGFDCAAYPALIQIMGKPNSGMEVKQLDIASGEYTEIYSIPFDRTPPFTGLNAIGINPVDSIIYGLMKLSTGAAYLVRFDAQNVAFLARVPELSAAGGVDHEGTFVWEKGTRFYAIHGIAEMEGFASPNDAVDLSQINPVVSGLTNVSDIATLRVDLGDGEGSYAMGVTPGRQLRIFGYDNPMGVWSVALTDSDGSTAGIPETDFGAAWSHDDRIYFGANSGAGVYEVLIDTIDLDAGTATARKVANSQATAWNDGTTCVGIDFIEPDPTPDPMGLLEEVETQIDTTTTLDVDEEVTSQALSKVETGESDNEGSFPTVGLIGALAGLAAVAGLGLTSTGQLMWKRITGFLAGSILGFLILGRKRTRCEHCSKQLSSKDGVLVDEDDNYECADNPDGDHHQLEEK